MSRIFEAYRRAGRSLPTESNRTAEGFALERFPGESVGRVNASEPAPILPAPVLHDLSAPVRHDEDAEDTPGRLSARLPEREPPRADIADIGSAWKRREDDLVPVSPGPSARAEDPGVEAQCRRLAARLSGPHAEASMRKILVSSVDRRACAGGVALALAAALADQGHRTLLIDSGHGAPLVHELLDLPPSGGLGDVLRGQDRVRALQLGPQLHLLPVGTRVPSTDEFRSASMREVLARCAGAYDWLVVSGTTAESDGATRTLLSLTDVSVLVVGETSPFPAVDRASSLLGGSLCGTVVVGLPL